MLVQNLFPQSDAPRQELICARDLWRGALGIAVALLHDATVLPLPSIILQLTLPWCTWLSLASIIAKNHAPMGLILSFE